MQVPLTRGAIWVSGSSPGGTAKDRLPVVGRKFTVCSLAFAEHEAGTFFTAFSGSKCFHEPGVLRRAVVGNQVNNDLEAQAVSRGLESIEVCKCAKERVHVTVVGHVITSILLRAGHKGGEPDGVNTEFFELGQARSNTGEVTNSITIRIREGTGVDLVNNGGTPPLFFTHGASLGTSETPENIPAVCHQPPCVFSMRSEVIISYGANFRGKLRRYGYAPIAQW